MKQLGLFAQPLARRTDPPQSHRAAEEIRPHLGALQRQALEMVARHRGRTAQEIADLEELRDPRTLNRRLCELRRRGLIQGQTVRPCTVTGRNAAEMEITEAGRIALAAGEVNALPSREERDG